MLSLDSLTSTCPSVPLMLPCPALPMTTASSGNITVPVKVLVSLVESSDLAVEELLGCLLGDLFSFAFKKNNNQAVVIYPPPPPPGQA